MGWEHNQKHNIDYNILIKSYQKIIMVKIFIKEIIFLGRTSKGPKYHVIDKVSYKEVN